MEKRDYARIKDMQMDALPGLFLVTIIAENERAVLR
jgi:hypothetical protein